MTTPEKMRREIESLTVDLISVGLCIDQNFPLIRTEGNGNVAIGFSEVENLSITLKNIPYHESYSELRKNRSFNIKLIDGALVQMMYRFRRDMLMNHRLAFFPSPDLLEYQNNSDIYEDDDLYGDVVMKNVVTTPVRFDFGREAFVDYDHPMSHLTIGQYKNCRIPVIGPLSPFVFMNFILRAFYNTPFKKFCGSIRAFSYEFAQTITDRERCLIHIGATQPAR